MSAKTSGFQLPGGWQWPEDLVHEFPPETANTEADTATASAPQEDASASAAETDNSGNSGARQRRTWPPRTCRICLEVVHPTFREQAEHIPQFLQGAPSVVYESEEGRLIRPCNCKGSSKYVHDGCLQAWRHADPGYGRRNYWQCPTCGFRYRLERMNWGHWIGSAVTQVILTVAICIAAIFVLGFVADPIINMYFDPMSTILSSVEFDEVYGYTAEPRASGWAEHFLKGFASLGLLGFAKMFFTLSPFGWFPFRGTGLFGRHARAGETGRDRVANINWLILVVGFGTFLYTVWTLVRAWSRRVLEKARERVMDVHADEDVDEEPDK